ncbi:hypothetical protein AALP_AA7G115800 [Arabis alpina]|uniref:Membrane protein of ER body-like protein n=1 Tax=Arabis alpina TaxID=50452 RepID=A0A087GHF1_ARAAL|nr:hypothetical protein AALP_AA7G115800 [Arabis alpina]
MEPTTNLVPTPRSAVDLGHQRESESNGSEDGSESVDKNQSPETVDLVRAKDSETEPESLDDDVEIVIKNQHEYYIYCPCCGEDITKTVKLVKKSDLQPRANDEVIDTKKGSRSKDKTTKFPSWFPVNLQQLFLSVYGQYKDKGKNEVDSKSQVYLGIDDKEPSIHVKIEKDTRSFPKWYLDVFAWSFLCIIIALSVLFTSPQQSPSVLSTSPPTFIPSHLQMPSVSSLQLPSASVLLLLPMFALVIMAMRSRYSPRFHKEKGDKRVDSKSSEEESQYQAADSDKKTDNLKVDPVPLHEQQILDKETAETAITQGLQYNARIEIPNKLEILKSIVYGGLTESITSLCTVTSAAASGASTLNVLALGVANLSSGLLLIVHSLQELISEKPRKGNQENSEEEGDRYEETLGRRDMSKLHSLIAISSFVVCGMIPPLVYGFSFRTRIERRQEYKTLAVYAVSLVCVVLLSIAKAYVSKKREYLKTLFRYTAMATTASGLSQFVGYLVSQWLQTCGFYDDSTPRL